MLFVDGFNVYHSLKSNPKYHKFLWLDFRTLAELFTKKNDTISGLYYFSACATWRPKSMKRHRILIDALKSRGVKAILGKFKEKDKYCSLCKRCFKSREEKQTDVNIAVHLVKEAFLDKYDTAFLMTNDTDLIPAIKVVKDHFPQKKIGVLFPIGRWSAELKGVCDFWRKIERKHLSKSQFPDKLTLPSGIILKRPSTWS